MKHQFLLLNKDGSIRFIDPIDHPGNKLIVPVLVNSLTAMAWNEGRDTPLYPCPVTVKETTYHAVRTDVDLKWLRIYAEVD